MPEGWMKTRPHRNITTEAPTGGSIRSASGSDIWEKMGLKGDPKPGLVLGLQESEVKGGRTCESPWLSPEEEEGVLECDDDAQRGRHHGTQTQTQQQQEKEHSSEGRPREQRDDSVKIRNTKWGLSSIFKDREVKCLLGLLSRLPTAMSPGSRSRTPPLQSKEGALSTATAFPTLPTSLSGTSERDCGAERTLQHLLALGHLH